MKKFLLIVVFVVSFFEINAQQNINLQSKEHKTYSKRCFMTAAVTSTAGVLLILSNQVQINPAVYDNHPHLGLNKDERIIGGSTLILCALAGAYVGIDEKRLSLRLSGNGIAIKYKINYNL